MIGRLKGTVVEKTPPQLLLDVMGVGYELEVPMSTFYELPQAGAEAVLLVQMIVREDAQLLYGFGSAREKNLFRLLLKVNGVGAKVALAILSAMSVDDFIITVEREDVGTLVRIPGVGKKTAERLLIELRDKLSNLGPALASVTAGEGLAGDPINPADVENGSTDDSGSTRSAGSHTPSAGQLRAQAMDALLALGYKPAETTRMVDAAVKAAAKAETSEAVTVEALIRSALRGVVSS